MGPAGGYVGSRPPRGASTMSDWVVAAHDSAAVRRAAGTIVAFEADELDPATCSGWSVTATGRAELVTDPDAIARYFTAVLMLMVRWAPGLRDHVMIDGQRVGPAPTSA